MLGGVVIGNPGFFIDKLFALVEESETKEKQFYLNAIRMIIVANPECLLDKLMELCEIFITHANHAEVTIRNVVSECMGKLFPLAADEMISYYDDGLKSDAKTRTTVCYSVRYISSRQKFPEPQML